MSWSNDNWFRDGVQNTFEYEMIEPGQLTESCGELEGVISGELTFSYYSHLKESGSLTISGSNYKKNKLIRIWHVAKYRQDERRSVLATMFVSGEDLTYKYGRYTGKLTLSSMLYRFERDLLAWDTGFSAGASALSTFKFVVNSAGGQYSIHSGIVDKKFNKSVVFPFGDANRVRLQHCADFLNAQIGVTRNGYIGLNPYTEPKYKSLTFNIPKGDDSITLVGVNVETNAYEINNRYAVKYESNNKSIFAYADVALSHPASYAKTAMRRTDCYAISDMTPETQARAQQIANQRRSLYSGATRKYEVNMFYMPLDATYGQCGNFQYQDTSGHKGINADVMVQQVELDLNYAMRQKVIFDEVKSYG